MTRIAHLAALLSDFRPLDDKERKDHAAMRSLVEAGEPALRRDHYVPGHFTASAFVLHPTSEQLLLILHAKLGMWLQPGGHVEPEDEDILRAARREVAEEVGLGDLTLVSNGVFDVDVHDIPPRREAPAHQHFDVRFLFRATSDAIQPASDAVDARWVPLHQVAEAQSDASVMRAVSRIMAM